MKISAWWILPVLIIGIAATYLYMNYVNIPSETVTISKRKKYDVITLALPNDSDPSVFGPKYWESFHRLADNIPCPGCRSKAVPFMKFFHDVVNIKTEKPVFDPENFNTHLDYISKLERA